jgi:pyruvate formate lyase activating enzyme
VKKISRKRFLKTCACASLGICSAPRLNDLYGGEESNIRLYKADYWKKAGGKKVRCELCPNACLVTPGENGKCRSRGNREGTYYSLSYGRPCVIALDSIEKSPLFHYQIDGKAFSVATPGCNLSCKYCHNWEYSQKGPLEVKKTYDLEPDEIIRRAKKHNAPAMNYFYTEPVVYYEYMKEMAKLARKEEMKNICVTAGYINRKPHLELFPLIDAFVIGLKGFTDSFYRNYIGGRLKPVLQTLERLAENRQRPWFEIVYLIVPGLNDSESDLKSMSAWVAGNIGKDVPLHFTRFYPAYKLKHLPATSPGTLTRAREIAMASGMRYVYIGNVPGSEGSHTYCPGCGEKVIERVGFKILRNRLKKGTCPCGKKIPGVWLKQGTQ